VQLAEAGVPFTLALNMADEAASRGITIDVPRLAGELGVDLAAVTGSGPGGRVTEGDVRAAADGVARKEFSRAAPVMLPVLERAPR
jgi:Fe2+ transport system protein B